MRTKLLKYATNTCFWVSMVEDAPIIIVNLESPIIPAEQWNRLRECICDEKDSTDDYMVYFDYIVINGLTDRFYSVSVGDWRRLGFSGNNIKHCMNVPEEVQQNCNMHLYNNLDLIKNSLHPVKRQQTIIKMLSEAFLRSDLKMLKESIGHTFYKVDMTDEEFAEWFRKVLQTVCQTVL